MSWLRSQAAGLRKRWFGPLFAEIEARSTSTDEAVEKTSSAIAELAGSLGMLIQEVGRLRFAVASLQASDARVASTLREAEFKGYSQFGEDGAIQWLLARIPIQNTFFVEFGVGDYAESNTRFLLEHDNWRGLIIDRGVDHIAFVRNSDLGWRRTLRAESAFVTSESINMLLREVPEDVGLLSVDIDGMDYWVLNAIIAIRPRIVVCEYNSLFGPSAAVSVPYAPDFDRRAVHFSTLYFGASISALEYWGRQRGYRLVGSSAEGVNAFFVRNDIAGNLPALTGPEAWVETHVRQARDRVGELTLLEGIQTQRALIASMPLVDVASGASLTVADLG